MAVAISPSRSVNFGPRPRPRVVEETEHLTPGNCHNASTMTKRLEQAIAKVRALSAERQDQAADVLLSLVELDPDSIQLSAEQVAEIERRLKTPPRHATHEEVRRFFQKRPA